jgi:hypothetical protein
MYENFMSWWKHYSKSHLYISLLINITMPENQAHHFYDTVLWQLSHLLLLLPVNICKTLQHTSCKWQHTECIEVANPVNSEKSWSQ